MRGPDRLRHQEWTSQWALDEGAILKAQPFNADACGVHFVAQCVRPASVHQSDRSTVQRRHQCHIQMEIKVLFSSLLPFAVTTMIILMIVMTTS